MTAPHLSERDGTQVEALIADRYLDGLLAAGDRRATDAPADAALDPDVREAARVLRAALVRVHPSFCFEERLAGRLADLAAAQAAPALTSGGGQVLAFPSAAQPVDRAAVDLASGPLPARRPLIVGGAITSAAISIVGVAWVAWRASRPGSSRAPGVMGRAARTAHARRAAAAFTGLGGPA